jgi:hypothetical protein
MSPTYSKDRFKTGSQHYFIEIKESVDNVPFVVLAQSYQKDGEWQRNKIRIFKEELYSVLGYLNRYRDKVFSNQYLNEKTEE